MTKPRVLISDKMDPNAEAIFRERGCDVDVITGETPEQLIARIGDYAVSDAQAQSSQGPRALRSAVSTVAPHQMRRPGGASRYPAMS